MLNKFILLILASILLTSCQKEYRNIEAIVIEKEEECVPVSEITSDLDSFYVFYPGDQEYGSANGIKINQDFEASARLYNSTITNTISISINTLWEPDIMNFNADQIYLSKITFDSTIIACHNLTNNKSNLDSIKCEYHVAHADIVLVDYQLDLDSINKLEIIEFDQDSLFIKAKMSAHFVTNEPDEPKIPKRVSFLNLEIEAREYN